MSKRKKSKSNSKGKNKSDNRSPGDKPQPSNNINRLVKRLADHGCLKTEEEQRDFVRSLMEPSDFPVGVVWVRDRPPNAFETISSPAWLPEFVDLVPFKQRPGRHELHDQGQFYCVDASSVFMMAGASIANNVDTLLDVCACPGGKSVIGWRMMNPSELWSNEVIGKRLGALISNLKRCEIFPSFVISEDTSKFADLISNTADVVLVDAPCSGQSLVAKGKPSPGCFHPATINMNANRQRRILANSASAVVPGGYLIYMTCTYSVKENENNVAWFLKKHLDFKAIPVASLAEHQSAACEHACYRLWPTPDIGAGGFFSVMQKDEGAMAHNVGCLKQLRIRWQGTNAKEA